MSNVLIVPDKPTLWLDENVSVGTVARGFRAPPIAAITAAGALCPSGFSSIS